MTTLATQSHTLASGATVTPVQFMDLTGLQEDVLWAIGNASRRGTLVRAAPKRSNADGTVTAEVHYVGEAPVLPSQVRAPLALEGPAEPIEQGRWDSWDTFSACLLAGKVAIGGGIAYLVYLGAVAAFTWLSVHLTAILGAIGAVLVVMLLLGAITGGKGCPGLHCGGCRG